ncbi:hypothetical protein CTheo_4728 [Ceratobasidium theobromae]|uniref:BZIP domain-containing protein n=1 Tax=Ceratobasidium theobromae TaxID=1582974 RepID=A0A5N5QJ99_9AGAM|nr:hypothetical protein CTheo_4728 [Ceratobasidium theobromae]
MGLPTPYYEDHEQLLAAFNERFNSWTPACAPQFPFGAEQFAAALNQNAYPNSFKIPSPPVSPSLSALSGAGPSSSSGSGFVSLANIAPPRNDTVFGWNSVSIGETSAEMVGTEQTLNPVLRSRNTLKRPASPSPTPSLSSSTSSTSMQQEVAPQAPAAAPKRARTQISSKDFVPPDVTGLSKREARLVKNRAAAFLSRQRKREEFEELERHCQDLERENARLKAGLGQSPSKKLKSDEAEPSQDVISELTCLRESNAQLAAQNAQLSAQNARLTAENARLAQREICPKIEDEDGSLLLSEPCSRREKESKEKHGTGSVALMVLMISLSLLGKPLASGMNNARARTAPMSLHTRSAPQPSSTFDFVLPRTNSDYEWLTPPTDLDQDDFAAVSLAPQPQSPATRTLTVQGLENLDIPTDIKDFNFSMDVDERDARNVVLAVSNSNPSSSSSDMSSISSPSSTSISTLDSAWPEPNVDNTMAMLAGDYMSYDYDSDIFGASLPISAPKRNPIPGTRRMTVAVVPPSPGGQGRWSVEVKESL